MASIITTILLALVAGVLGFLTGRFIWPVANGSGDTQLNTAQNDAVRFSDESNSLKLVIARLEVTIKLKDDAILAEGLNSARLDERSKGLERRMIESSQLNLAANADRNEREGALKAAAETAARLIERASGHTIEVESLNSRLRSTSDELESAQTLKKAADEENARFGERISSLSKDIVELRGREEKLQETLKAEFENIATKVLKANTTELSDTSQKQIAAILDPLRERIQEFKGIVENTYEIEKRDVLSLKEQIKLVMESGSALGLQADGLAKALKGDVQLLGRWGELVLERILQAAGLMEGREYITQGRGLALKSDEGVAQKPDVIIKLPENRTMVIDSKVSLASYDRLISSQEPERAACAAQLVRDVKFHIDGLAGKRYQDNDKLNAHDCVLMFVPIEGALAAALMADPELFTYAWDKRVVIVGPPTLLMTLRTIASIWRYEMQSLNAQDIAKMAGMLCDKVSASLIDMNSVTEKLDLAVSTHRDAVKRLSTGKGNVLSVGARIHALGVKAKSNLPAMKVGDESIIASADFGDDLMEVPAG